MYTPTEVLTRIVGFITLAIILFCAIRCMGVVG